MKKVKKITMTIEVEETEVPETLPRESSTEEWDEKSPEEKKRELREAETTVFVDDLGDMFVSTDCGGDLNFHVFGERDVFVSLEPEEIRLLHKALSDRIAEYDKS